MGISPVAVATQGAGALEGESNLHVTQASRVLSA